MTRPTSGPRRDDVSRAAAAGADPHRLGAAARAVERPRPTRVIVDARPLQEPEQAPVTAAYLGRLLAACAADPLDGESWVVLSRADLPEPDGPVDDLPVAARRVLPATRFLRAGAQTVDPFVVRGASILAGRGAQRDGAIGTVYHAAGTVLPIGEGVPVVATVLDLAPWQLPGTFQRSLAARFGARLRARLLRDARFVVCGTDAVAELAVRRLHVPRERVRVVRLAARDAFRPGAGTAAGEREAEQRRLGLPGRYLVWFARHDARQDGPSLLASLRALAGTERPTGLPSEETWPPRVLVVEAAPADRAEIARAAARVGLVDAFSYAPGLPDERLAALVAGARAAIMPVVSDAAGFGAIEPLAAGVPVVAAAVGALPELVGGAGILVPPRSPERLAAALRAIWADDDLRGRLAAETPGAADEGAGTRRRTWADVAHEMRLLYAEAADRR